MDTVESSQASQLEALRCSGTTHGNSKQSSLTPSDLPVECLHSICQQLEDSDKAKVAAMCTCHILRSAVLESCTVLLKLHCPAMTFAWPRNATSPEQRGKAWQAHARLLQQAKHVELRYKFWWKEGVEQGVEQGQGFLLNWLGEMFQQCNGPLLSVRKLTMKGESTPLETLPHWLPVFCPNVKHLETSTGDIQCDMGLLVSRVYSKLESITMCLPFQKVEQRKHMLALLAAPHLERVALKDFSISGGDYAHRECNWRVLHMLDEVRIRTLARLPWRGVEHLVLGSRKQDILFTLDAAYWGSNLDHDQDIKAACDHLTKYRKVTLSTDHGIFLGFSNSCETDAALALPMLQYARPYCATSHSVPGLLTIFGLEKITLHFIKRLGSSLSSAVTQVCFAGTRIWGDETLAQLVFCMPPHITGFSILDRDSKVCWEDAQWACRHAERPIALLVPSHNIVHMDDKAELQEISGVVRSISDNWPAIVQDMLDHGRQYISLKIIKAGLHWAGGLSVVWMTSLTQAYS